ncbi:MAG: CcmD family protein [Bacteroidia bacterium]
MLEASTYTGRKTLASSLRAFAFLLGLGILLPLSATATNLATQVNDSLGRPMAAAKVELRVELTTGTMDGETQYAETHAVQTDPAGVAAIDIGMGQVTDPKYVFDNFDIAQGSNFVRLSIKDAGGWRLLLKSQLPNVPQVRKWLFAGEKANTVIAIMVIVWLGIVVYLLLTGRRLRALEKRVVEYQQRERSKS